VFSALLGIAAMAFAAALMLSDRAPSVLRRLFGEDARRLWDRIDASERAQFVNQAGVPEADFVIHVMVWAVIVLLVAMAIWTWRGLTAVVAGVSASSVIIEVAQGRYSDTRSVELDDLVANGVGVAIGACAAALMYLAWSGLASSVNARYR
jgi:VanZ family protein